VCVCLYRYAYLHPAEPSSESFHDTEGGLEVVVVAEVVGALAGLVGTTENTQKR